ncbi:MAG: hypothetical protein HQM14_19460 [SAR324 cluster bacterium]|nr:hypothetical protein [SAR324 cluster bacterium]
MLKESVPESDDASHHTIYDRATDESLLHSAGELYDPNDSAGKHPL